MPVGLVEIERATRLEPQVLERRQPLHLTLRVLEEMGIADRKRSLTGQRRQKTLVPIGEVVARPFRQDDRAPDIPPAGNRDRDRRSHRTTSEYRVGMRAPSGI